MRHRRTSPWRYEELCAHYGMTVVEDQEDNRQILRDLLGNAGYELTEADNGEEAIAAVARRRPDLTRRIRTNPALKPSPIYAGTSAPGLFR